MTNLFVQIAADKLTKIAEENWSTAVRSKAKAPAFKPSIVDQIYTTELNGNQDAAPKLKRVMLLEISQYLENYLWPNFDEETATYEHVMSIILMVNEKFRENVPAWDGFSQREDALPGFFNHVTTLKTGRQLRQHEKVSYLMFAINAFQSLENSAVRARVLKLASLPLWHALSEGRRQVSLHITYLSVLMCMSLRSCRKVLSIISYASIALQITHIALPRFSNTICEPTCISNDRNTTTLYLELTLSTTWGRAVAQICAVSQNLHFTNHSNSCCCGMISS